MLRFIKYFVLISLQYHCELPVSSQTEDPKNALPSTSSSSAKTSPPSSSKATVLLSGSGPLGVRVFERLAGDSRVGKVVLAGFEEEVGPSDADMLINTGPGVLGAKAKEPLWKKLKGSVIFASRLLKLIMTVFLDLAKSRGSTVEVHHVGGGDEGGSSPGFSAGVMSEVDAIVSAGGDWDARRAVGNHSVQFGKALLDVGIDKMLGHVQVKCFCAIPGSLEKVF